jgi:ribosomal protein S18 acetylase RimI-like enzyme
MKITRIEKIDLPEILALQHLAYESEARLLDDFTIPPLLQTLEEIEREFASGVFLKATDENGKIIGSVRAHSAGETVYVGKLIVQPELQGQGIGTRLLNAIEAELPSARYELFTSHKSLRTLRLYEHLGYERFKEQKISDKLTLVFLEKIC